MEKNNPVAKSVDEYLERLPDDQKKVLSELRRIILSTARDAEEVISYQMPGYKYKGGPLVFFAAFTRHCSLFGVSKLLLKTFEKELRPFHTSGTTIHFTPENPLPPSLVKKIVKERLQQNDERFQFKQAGKSAKKKSAVRIKK